MTMKKKHYETPTQVRFIDLTVNQEDQTALAGIAYKDEIICGCCGGVFNLDEVMITKTFHHWVSLKDEIIGN